MKVDPSPQMLVSMVLLAAGTLLFLLVTFWPRHQPEPVYVPPTSTLVAAPSFVLPTPTAREAGPPVPHRRTP